MKNNEEPPLVATAVMFMMIFGIMAVILHDMSESIATDVVRHNSVSFLCPPK